MDSVLKFHAKASQATASEGFARVPYVTARAGLEHTTFQMKGVESTNEPPRFHNSTVLEYSVSTDQLLCLNVLE